MKYYTIVVAHYFQNLPESTYIHDHIVCNDLDRAYEVANKMQDTCTRISPLRIEESYFKKNVLVSKKVIKDFTKED